MVARNHVIVLGSTRCAPLQRVFRHHISISTPPQVCQPSSGQALRTWLLELGESPRRKRRVREGPSPYLVYEDCRGLLPCLICTKVAWIYKVTYINTHHFATHTYHFTIHTHLALTFDINFIPHRNSYRDYIIRIRRNFDIFESFERIQITLFNDAKI